MLRRMVLVMAAAALTAVMIVAMSAPAFARINSSSGCVQKPGEREIFTTSGNAQFASYDRNGDQIICGYTNPQGKEHFNDNHVH